MSAHELDLRLDGDNWTGRCACGWEQTAAESDDVNQSHESHAKKAASDELAECPDCDGEGMVEGDCFEDTCCCAEPHELEDCTTCQGTGSVLAHFLEGR